MTTPCFNKVLRSVCCFKQGNSLTRNKDCRALKLNLRSRLCSVAASSHSALDARAVPAEVQRAAHAVSELCHTTDMLRKQKDSLDVSVSTGQADLFP